MGSIWAAKQSSSSQALIDVRRSACHSEHEWQGTVYLVEAAPEMLAKLELCSQILGDIAMAINHHCDLKDLSRDEWRTWLQTIEHFRSVLAKQHHRGHRQTRVLGFKPRLC